MRLVDGECSRANVADRRATTRAMKAIGLSSTPTVNDILLLIHNTPRTRKRFLRFCARHVDERHRSLSLERDARVLQS